MAKILNLIPGLFLFSLVPLAGYGFFDLTGFFGSAPRGAFLALTVINTFFSAFFVRYEGQQVKSAKTLISENRLWFVQFQLVPLLNIFVAPLTDNMGAFPLPGGDAIRWAGVAVLVLAFVLMNASVQYLGKFFTINLSIQDGHKLIQSGPYRFVRHPRYTGIILLSLGLAMVFASSVGLVFTVAILINLILRIGREEKMLAAEFGQEWTDYRSKTKSLIPFVY